MDEMTQRRELTGDGSETGPEAVDDIYPASFSSSASNSSSDLESAAFRGGDGGGASIRSALELLDLRVRQTLGLFLRLRNAGKQLEDAGHELRVDISALLESAGAAAAGGGDWRAVSKISSRAREWMSAVEDSGTRETLSPAAGSSNALGSHEAPPALPLPEARQDGFLGRLLSPFRRHRAQQQPAHPEYESQPDHASQSAAPAQSQPLQSPTAPASTLFPFMHVVEHPDDVRKATPPRLVYVSLSTDLRLILANSLSSKPSSLLDFRHADWRLDLEGMSYELQVSVPPSSLDDLVAPRVRPEAHPTGSAVRIADEKRSILLIAPSEEERDAIIFALRLRVAPWPVLRNQMEAEMRGASLPSASEPSLADAAIELLSGAAGASGASAGSTYVAGEQGEAGVAKMVRKKAGTLAKGPLSYMTPRLGQGSRLSLAEAVRELLSSATGAGSLSLVEKKGTAGVARLVWEKAGTVALVYLSDATFGGELGKAKHLGKFAKQLAGLTIVGCTFSLLSLSSMAVSLMGMEREGKDRLAQARQDLREASVSLVRWLFSVVGSELNDEDGLIGRSFDVLGECWGEADKLEQFLMQRLPMRTWNAGDMGMIVAKVKILSDKLHTVCAVKKMLVLEPDAKRNRSTASAIASGTGNSKDDQPTPALQNGDVFRPHHPNARHLSEGLEATAATSLARLKATVLPPDAGEKSTSMYSRSSLRRVALTSINSEGGVGKTSSCKLLCVDEDVRAHFSEGAILWIDIGQGASEEKVVDEIRNATSKCGGMRTAEEIRSSSDIFEALDIARGFFSKRRILVVLDNIWETPAKSRSRGFGSIELGRYDLTTVGSQGWLTAEHLYDSLLEATPEERSEDSYKEDRKEVLKISCGLPIVISTFVGLVRIRRLGDGGVGKLLAKIQGNVNVLVGRSAVAKVKTITCHPGLIAVMEECLAHLDEHSVFDTKLTSLNLPEENDPRVFRAKYCDESGKQLSSRYAALEVMSKSSTRLSFPVLRHVWHVEEADGIAQLFENIGLGRIEEGRDGQDDVFCLHDLQYDYCVSLRYRPPRAAADVSVSMPGSASGHALFLSSCESLLLNVLTAGDDVCEGWAWFCFAEGRGISEVPLRQYLARNLLRHICGATDDVGNDVVKYTAMGVLSDFGWLLGRIVVGGGPSSAILVCATALASRSYISAGSSAQTSLLTGGAEKSIRALQQSLMLVGEGVSLESDGTLAGSLIQLSQSAVGSGDAGLDTDFLRKLAFRTESAVSGAWVKPIHGCSRERGEGVLAQAVVGNGYMVRSLASLGDGEHFVSGSADGVLRVHEIEYLDDVLALNGHTEEENCVDVAKNEWIDGSFLLFSVSNDGTVRSWEVGLDRVEGIVEKASVVVGDCGSPVGCLSVSRGGDLVAAGSESGILFIWERQRGDAAFLFKLVDSYRCATAADRGTGVVRGVAVSQSGDFVVGSGGNAGIAFWSRARSGVKGTLERLTASDESGAHIRHVLLSEDESSVSFVFDDAGCEIWDVASKRRRMPRVALSDLKLLDCASLSDDETANADASGSRDLLVVGGWDERGSEFVTMYSTRDDFKTLSKYPFLSTPRSVCCASLGSNKRMLVGCDDGCVRMLDASVSIESDDVESCVEGVPEREDVSTVAVMPTAGLVIAGHEDGGFSLWRAESGEFVRAFEDERALDSFVLCIDISANELLAVSGHGNGVALVWDASTWKCRFALQREGHSKSIVCATILADSKRIVSADFVGKVRFWDAESSGATLWTISTELDISDLGSRGTISLDGRLFLWGSRDDDQKWRAKLIDLEHGSIISCETEESRDDWDSLMEGLTLQGAFDSLEEGRWRLGAMFANRLVELRQVETDQSWRISSHDVRRTDIPRIDCALLSAGGEVVLTHASLGFDRNVMSISAEWIIAEEDQRRAVVACGLRRSSIPAVMHLCPAKY